jgi:phage-related protein
MWIRSAKKDLVAMPSDVQEVFGSSLHLAQAGKKHDKAKPLKGFGGAGVLEVVDRKKTAKEHAEGVKSDHD